MSYNYPEVPTDFKAMSYRLVEARRQGKVNSQLRQVGNVQQGWLARQRRQLLHHAGIC